MKSLLHTTFGSVRLFAISAICLFGSVTLAQDQPEQKPTTTAIEGFRPQMMIFVREHELGPDMVRISTVTNGYPAELLKAQVTALGEYLGSAPRGLAMNRHEIPGTASKIETIEATFAVDGLIDAPNGLLNIEPIVRAFAGAPAPNTVSDINLYFEGIKPIKSTIQRFDSDAVLMTAQYNESPRGTEYRIRILNQDAAKIVIPASVDAADKLATDAKVDVQSRPNALLIVAGFALAAVALGALVYFAVLRGSARRRI